MKQTNDIAAFRESIQRKQEWQEKSNERIQKIREERMLFYGL